MSRVCVYTAKVRVGTDQGHTRSDSVVPGHRNHAAQCQERLLILDINGEWLAGFGVDEYSGSPMPEELGKPD